MIIRCGLLIIKSFKNLQFNLLVGNHLPSIEFILFLLTCFSLNLYIYTSNIKVLFNRILIKMNMQFQQFYDFPDLRIGIRVPITRILLSGLFLVVLVCLELNTSAQHKKSNWLQDKKEYTSRWRMGFGIDVLEPTGVDIQFYRLSKICTNDFSILKKIAIGVWVGKEGILTSSVLKKIKRWESGGLRYGLDLKFHIPIFLNPYMGFGVEGGTRKLNGTLDFYPDAVVRLGIEQKVIGIKMSSTSSINATIFVDGKVNKCITNDFMYILPSAGIRFHFL